MFNGGFYGVEVVFPSGTWGPRAHRRQAGGTIHLCDLGPELKLRWTSVSLCMKIEDRTR